MSNPESLWTLADAALHMRKTSSALYTWRWRGIGPPGVKARGKILYCQSDIDEWLDSEQMRQDQMRQEAAGMMASCNFDPDQDAVHAVETVCRAMKTCIIEWWP